MTKPDLPADAITAKSEATNHAMSAADISAVIGMAWQDDTPFEAMALQFGLSEAQVIALMRELGLVEVGRTGVVGMMRGAEAV